MKDGNFFIKQKKKFFFLKVVQRQFKVNLKFNENTQKCNSNVCVTLKCSGLEKNIDECKIINSTQQIFQIRLVYSKSIFSGFSFTNSKSIDIFHLKTFGIGISISKSEIHNLK